MNESVFIEIFDDEEKLVLAAQELKKQGASLVDFHTPFPVHGLDDLLDIKRSRLPNVTLIAGTCGLLVAIIFQVWTSAFAWPLNIGGKPMLSIPAFIPITFELMILFGALSTVAAFLFVSNLFPTKEVELYDLKQTDNKFVIVVRKEDENKNAEYKKIMERIKNEHHS